MTEQSVISVNALLNSIRIEGHCLKTGQGNSFNVKEFQKVVSVAGIAGKFLVTQSSVAWIPVNPTTLVGLTGTRAGMAAKSAQKLTLTSFHKRYN